MERPTFNGSETTPADSTTGDTGTANNNVAASTRRNTGQTADQAPGDTVAAPGDTEQAADPTPPLGTPVHPCAPPADDLDDWQADPRIKITTPEETSFIPIKEGAWPAAVAAAAEDQRVIDQASKEAALEFPDYDPMKHIRLRTWLAVTGLVANSSRSTVWAGRETQKLDTQSGKPQLRELLRNGGGELLSSLEKELRKQKQRLQRQKKVAGNKRSQRRLATGTVRQRAS